MRVRILMMLAFSCIPALRATAAEHRWDTYVNVRYSYQICYPADLMVPQPEADNGDGRVFTTPAGATLRVWGRYNAMGESLATITKRLPEPGSIVTYRHIDTTKSIVSGKIGDDIFYAETMLGKDDTIRSFILLYAATQAATFNPIADRLSRCFSRIVS
jgi:hypothetical protein